MTSSPIAAMFDRISPKYDTLNHLLSLNTDKAWRRKTAIEVAKNLPCSILDIATGTADLAIAMAKSNPKAHIVGIDLSEKMLSIGKSKIKAQKLENQIEMLTGDVASLPFADGSFDAVTVAFGVRNFEDLDKSLSEISRVVKTGGRVVILEFSMPKKTPIKQLYSLYFKYLLPKIGKAVSKDSGAYTYLPQSVERFPEPDVFRKTLASFGMEDCSAKPLTFGIATLYSAQKTPLSPPTSATSTSDLNFFGPCSQ